ncbi:MAG: UDP-N-acetylglucosamine--N-acetylmuramyl-(pentapeptide) pyrophosphoryl-undecaprenol N-acetylglucosamine transferase [Actinomycetes bacterium]
MSDVRGPIWAIVAGGGTAGHVLPGIAVANALVARGHLPSTIHFVGAERGSERTLVPDAGFSITLLPGRGVQRRLTAENIGALVGLVRAVFQAVVLVRRTRPSVVLAVGGFASVATAIAAVLWRVPLVIAEQNARAGAANRLVARWARACAVPFPETDLPRAVVTGNPVRQTVLDVAARGDTTAARAALGVPDGRTLVVSFAGSLGSRRLNDATFECARRWSHRTDLAVYHVVGARDWDEDRVPADLTGTDGGFTGLWYRAVRYETQMDVVLAAADLAVCRSGGTTVAELAVMGLPAVLVPLPIATRDHQRFNAGALVAAGAAVLIDDEDFTADRMEREVGDLLEPGRLESMATAARSQGRVDAADAVADLVESAAGRPGGVR